MTTLIDPDLELSWFESGSMPFGPHILPGGDPCMGKDVPPI